MQLKVVRIACACVSCSCSLRTPCVVHQTRPATYEYNSIVQLRVARKEKKRREASVLETSAERTAAHVREARSGLHDLRQQGAATSTLAEQLAAAAEECDAALTEWSAVEADTQV